MSAEKRVPSTTGTSNTNQDDDDSDVEIVAVVPSRRSGRKRVSTTMIIDGHVVKRENNYIVKGMTYEKGIYVEDEAKPQKKKQKVVKKKAPPTERKVSSTEVARMKHNDAIKVDVQAKLSYRRDFLVKNKSTLDPFMDDATRRMLQQWSESKMSSSKAYKKVEIFTQPDLITGGEMRDYQLAGLNFLVNLHLQGIGMILGDEMGLGKTLQTISFLCYLKERNENLGPSLIVCPLSVLYSWCSEFEKWAPSLRVLRLHASNQEDQAQQRKELVEGADKYDAIVTTYDMVKVPQMMHMWKRIHFRIVCLDEGHKIKAIDTLVAQAVRKLHCENRLLLTGTPLQNNLAELVSLLNFLQPDIFTNFEPFKAAFDITNNVIDKQKMMQAQKVLGIFMLRRLKDQVEKLMPRKIETKVYCPLSKKQVFWYKSILMKDISTLARQEANGATLSSTQKLAGLFMQLRKACLHPFLFDGAEADVATTTVQDLIGASGKLAVLDSLLISLFKKGHRCVLFSQFTSVLDILADYCSMRGWKHLSFDGRTSRGKRNYYVNAFNEPKSPFFLFLMSTRSGSMGLNLQTADTCILFDSDFNPQMDLQAMARVHRIGQTKTVHVYRLVASGTVEERLLQRAEKKLLLDQMVNRERSGSGDADDEKNSKMSAAELLKDIKFGSAAVFGDSSLNTLPTKKDINHITDRKRSETDDRGKLKGNNYHHGDTFDTSKKLAASQTFQGINFQALREQQLKQSQASIPTSLKGIARLWNEISALGDKKRERKNRIVMVDGNKSGYGQALVPVLAGNNYDLEKGESSVFDRELSSRSKHACAVPKKKSRKKVPENQDFCQACGDGGLLYLCSRCPCSAHKECCKSIHETKGSVNSCGHHWCSICKKPAHFAGGILYPCQSCPNAFCEDCLPEDVFRFLGDCPRFEAMGFDSTKTAVYIHCSAHCEEYAIDTFGWKPPKSRQGPCPQAIDVSNCFGGNSDAPKRLRLKGGVAEVPSAVSTEGSSTESSECGSSSDAAEIVDLTED